MANTFASLPSADFRIEFFSSPECDDSGYGEGAGFLGSIDVETDANGHAEGETATETATIFSANVVATATVRNPILDLAGAGRPRDRVAAAPLDLRVLALRGGVIQA